MSAPPVKHFYELKEWPSLQTSSEVKRWLGHFFAALSALIIEKCPSLSSDENSFVSLLKTTCYRDAPESSE